MARAAYGGGRGAGRGGYPPDPAYAAAAAAGPFGPFGAGGRGGPGRGGAYWGPEAAYLGYYPVGPPGAFYAPAAAPATPVFPRGRGGFFPGGKNWAGARPPPPGQPGFSSGLQVRRAAGAGTGGLELLCGWRPAGCSRAAATQQGGLSSQRQRRTPGRRCGMCSSGSQQLQAQR